MRLQKLINIRVKWKFLISYIFLYGFITPVFTNCEHLKFFPDTDHGLAVKQQKILEQVYRLKKIKVQTDGVNLIAQEFKETVLFSWRVIKNYFVVEFLTCIIENDSTHKHIVKNETELKETYTIRLAINLMGYVMTGYGVKGGPMEGNGLIFWGGKVEHQASSLIYLRRKFSWIKVGGVEQPENLISLRIVLGPPNGTSETPLSIQPHPPRLDLKGNCFPSPTLTRGCEDKKRKEKYSPIRYRLVEERSHNFIFTPGNCEM